ncbi:ribonuclease HII [Weissella tructae]|uniref:Ribonuclease HII n=2 Tax=Weissella TaxID=46255 RepID=A0A075TZT8_9LACO|nr:MULTISPECIES: ribonuclease HII [Weissella]AIG65388.1 Ribonuclease HII [Weissella tructae]AIM62702.1 Ribonuclease HII [Weissella ceti]AIM64037.1 Ribonuclease HII [Weissella ceti]ELA07152.1 ribonuclease HII [Weissella ceti NC36]QVV91767.1 ribonuclease HII [Weissella tructae]
MPNETIASIKAQLAAGASQEDLTRWQADTRQGVQKLLAQEAKRAAKAKADTDAFNERLSFEHDAWGRGLTVAGVDEVGRGPLAGPVVACAVVIDDSFDLISVHDSKQLSQVKREALDADIKSQVVAYAFSVIDADVIDDVNIYEASRIAMKEAIEKLPTQPDELLLDAMTVDLPQPQEKLIKGDDRSISIGAASILAKNYRDALMTEYAQKYPGYGFENHAGYGTKQHLTALDELGVTPIHRKTFSPVMKYLK